MSVWKPYGIRTSYPSRRAKPVDQVSGLSFITAEHILGEIGSATNSAELAGRAFDPQIGAAASSRFVQKLFCWRGECPKRRKRLADCHSPLLAARFCPLGWTLMPLRRGRGVGCQFRSSGFSPRSGTKGPPVRGIGTAVFLICTLYLSQSEHCQLQMQKAH